MHIKDIQEQDNLITDFKWKQNRKRECDSFISFQLRWHPNTFKIMFGESVNYLEMIRKCMEKIKVL